MLRTKKKSLDANGELFRHEREEVLLVFERSETILVAQVVSKDRL